MIDRTINFITGLTLDGYGFIIGVMLIAFLYGMWKANKSEKSKFSWDDLITNTDMVTGVHRASVTKILQLVGGVASTFIVVKLTLQDRLTWDIFCTYLAYVASIDGFSKFLLAKYGIQNKDNSQDPK